jgi:hypothetical protein
MVVSREPYWIFSSRVRCNNDGSWGTIAICCRKLFCLIAAISWPSIKILPELGSYRRKIKLIKVDLPLPENPTKPTFCPPLMTIDLFVKIFASPS